MRREILFNDNWLFHKGDIYVPVPPKKGLVYTQSKAMRKLVGPAAYNYFDRVDPFYPIGKEMKNELWESALLPHDYVVAQDLKENENNALGYVHYDNAWYRKHFTLENAEGKRVVIRFDGIAGESTIYLNGCLLYRNYSRYNTFEVDVSDIVYTDKENVLAVYVNTKEFEGWWYQGGGIYRDVWLTITEPVAIDLWGVYAPYKKINDNDWQIDFETKVINTGYEACFVTVESEVIDNSGNTVSKSIGEGKVLFRNSSVIKYNAIVENPDLWDCDNPNLYKIKTVLKMNGIEIDETYTRIGFRTVEFSSDNGMLLNGKKTFIKGVCAHQDFGLTGLAVPNNIAKYKIKLIKDMGANGYRTSHYQHTAAYLDACDEMGILVMDETRWFESTEESFKQIDSLVKRDRNRPSVVMWSTSNEEPLHITQNGRNIHKAIATHIRKLDYTRPITAAQDKTPDKSTIYSECDLIGINYNLDLFDKVHEMSPEKPMFASECCATGSTRDWHFDTDRNTGRIRDYDADTNSWFVSRKKAWQFYMERPYVFGAYQWISIDHRGEAEWPAISSKSGAIDMFLQKKSAFYLNKSYWTEEPLVHIVPHWNFKGLEGQKIFIPIYTNCDELELFLNGVSLGRQKIEKYSWGEWDVPYVSGELFCLGYKNGKQVCEDRRVTSGKPTSFRFTPLNDFKPNGEDIALFTCECVDEKGNIVPDADEFVSFSVNSPTLIVGTGSDNTDHKSVKNTSRQMYMGKITVAVKPAVDQKELILTAKSNSIGLGRIIVKLN